MRTQVWLFAALVLLATTRAVVANAQSLPDSVRSAGVTQAQWEQVQLEVRRAAADRGASERALQAVAERISVNLVQDGHIDLEQVLRSIDERARQIVDLQTQLVAMETADDPGVTELLRQARLTIDNGDLSSADQLLGEAAQNDLAGIARDRARLTTRQHRAAQTIGERAALAMLSAEYERAADLYGNAATTLDPTEFDLIWTYRTRQAEALRDGGEWFADPDALDSAATLVRDVMLPAAPRASHPLQWASANYLLGGILRGLGEVGQEGALNQSVEAYQAVLEVRTRNDYPNEWAITQGELAKTYLALGMEGDDAAMQSAITALRNAQAVHSRADHPFLWADYQNTLGATLRVVGERGDDEALQQSIDALHSALEIRTRDAVPEDWALTQTNLGNALRILGEHGDREALEGAVAAFRAAMEVNTRETAPVRWARIQNNLGLVLQVSGELQAEPARFRESIGAFESALEVFTRDREPARWAIVQANLGITHWDLGIHGEPAAFHRSIAAYRSSMEVQTRQANEIGWAANMQNLGNALYELGVRGDEDALQESVVVQRAAFDVYTKERAPDLWALGQVNLGGALSAQAEQGNRRAAREALVAYRAAQEVITPDTDPVGYARSQSGIAGVLTIQAERDNESQTAAIAAYRQSLQALDRETAVSDWSDAMHGLANAQRLEAIRTRNEAMLRDSISTHRAALAVITLESNPYRWALIHFTLAQALKSETDMTRSRDYGSALSSANIALDAFGRAGDAAGARRARRLVESIQRTSR